jgi:HD-like signal output (HDOD) protein
VRGDQAGSAFRTIAMHADNLSEALDRLGAERAMRLCAGHDAIASASAASSANLRKCREKAARCRFATEARPRDAAHG